MMATIAFTDDEIFSIRFNAILLYCISGLSFELKHHHDNDIDAGDCVGDSAAIMMRLWLFYLRHFLNEVTHTNTHTHVNRKPEK